MANPAFAHTLTSEGLVRSAAAVSAIFASDIPNSVKLSLENVLHDARAIDSRLAGLWVAAMDNATVNEDRAFELAHESNATIRLAGVRLLQRLVNDGVPMDRDRMVTALRESLQSMDRELTQAGLDLAISWPCDQGTALDLADLARNVMSLKDADDTTIDVLDPRRVAEMYLKAGANQDAVANFFASCFGGLSSLNQHLLALECIGKISPDSETTQAILDEAIAKYPPSIGRICSLLSSYNLPADYTAETIDAALKLTTDPAAALVGYGWKEEDAKAGADDIATYVGEHLATALANKSIPDSKSLDVFAKLATTPPRVQATLMKTLGAIAKEPTPVGAAAKAFVHEGLVSALPLVRTSAVIATRDMLDGAVPENEAMSLAQDPSTASAVADLLQGVTLAPATTLKIAQTAMASNPDASVAIAQHVMTLPFADADRKMLAGAAGERQQISLRRWRS